MGGRQGGVSHQAHHQAEIDRLREEARVCPRAPASCRCSRKRCEFADTHNDLETGYQVRQDVIHVASDTGRPDVELVHFSWCLAKFDAHAKRRRLGAALEIQVDGRGRSRASRRSAASRSSICSATWSGMRGGWLLTTTRCISAAATRSPTSTTCRPPPRRGASSARPRDAISDCRGAAALSGAGVAPHGVQCLGGRLVGVETVLESRMTCTFQPLNAGRRALLALFQLNELDQRAEPLSEAHPATGLSLRRQPLCRDLVHRYSRRHRRSEKGPPPAGPLPGCGADGGQCADAAQYKIGLAVFPPRRGARTADNSPGPAQRPTATR